MIGVSEVLYKNFFKFHKKHPHVWEIFKVKAWQAKEAGKLKYGAKAIMEAARWEYEITEKFGDEFVINNNYTALYARMMVEKFPDFNGFFEFRELQSNKGPGRFLNTSRSLAA